MDYVKNQKEAITIVKQMVADGQVAQDIAEKYFPELQESEDERIRKAIINVFASHVDYEIFFGVSVKDIIAWLEKQGQVKEYTFKSLPRLLDMIEPSNKAKAYCRKLMDALVKEGYAIDAKIVGECLKKMNGEDVPMATMDEKQGEQKSIDDLTQQEAMDIAVAKCFEQSEQKPADKVEPKFKPGYWVATNYGKVNQVVSVDKDGNGYTLDDGVYFSDSWCDMYHLWTIQDAKDGDVLFHSDSASNGIFIFKELLKYEFSEKVICYCDYDSEDHFCLGEHHTCCWADAKILHPATKEQRDLLFQKMEEAGYEWNTEKKELKKIEQKPQRMVSAEAKEALYGKSAWSEEDESNIQNIDSVLFYDKNLPEDTCMKLRNWLKSLRPQNKYAYNPYKEVVESIAEMCEHYDKTTDLQDFYDNVKVKCKEAKEYDSLFPQNTWKPSDEQMERLKGTINSLPHQEVLYSLYQD